MALERNVAGEWQLYEQGEGRREGSKRLGHIVAIAHDVSVPLYPSGSACHAAVRQLVNGNEDVCGESEVATRRLKKCGKGNRVRGSGIVGGRCQLGVDCCLGFLKRS